MGRKELDVTEQLTLSLFRAHLFIFVFIPIIVRGGS